MLVYEILVCEFMSLCVDEDMGLWLCTNVVLRVSGDVGLCRYVFVWLLVCLLARRHVNLQLAYCPPRSTRTLTPLSWWREGREVFYSILFVTSFAKYVRFLLSNVVPKFVLRNP